MIPTLAKFVLPRLPSTRSAGMGLLILLCLSGIALFLIIAMDRRKKPKQSEAENLDS